MGRTMPPLGSTGSKDAHLAARHVATTSMNSGLRGRWDRNRTGNLRFGALGALSKVVQ
jgi:hypothetical protein